MEHGVFVGERATDRIVLLVRVAESHYLTKACGVTGELGHILPIAHRATLGALADALRIGARLGVLLEGVLRGVEFGV